MRLRTSQNETAPPVPSPARRPFGRARHDRPGTVRRAGPPLLRQSRSIPAHLRVFIRPPARTPSRLVKNHCSTPSAAMRRSPDGVVYVKRQRRARPSAAGLLPPPGRRRADPCLPRQLNCVGGASGVSPGASNSGSRTFRTTAPSRNDPATASTPMSMSSRACRRHPRRHRPYPAGPAATQGCPPVRGAACRGRISASFRHVLLETACERP